MRPLDDYLPAYEFSERHALEIDAGREQRRPRAAGGVDRRDPRHPRASTCCEGSGATGRDTSGRSSDWRGWAAVCARGRRRARASCFGLTGQFWRLRGGQDLGRPRTAEEFLAYDRPDVCKAVIDFRIAELGAGRCRLTTETRVHVDDPAARRAFRRYWLVVRPFSGLTRILFLREVRRQALEM